MLNTRHHVAPNETPFPRRARAETQTNIINLYSQSHTLHLPTPIHSLTYPFDLHASLCHINIPTCASSQTTPCTPSHQTVPRFSLCLAPSRPSMSRAFIHLYETSIPSGKAFRKQGSARASASACLHVSNNRQHHSCAVRDASKYGEEIRDWKTLDLCIDERDTSEWSYIATIETETIYTPQHCNGGKIDERVFFALQRASRRAIGKRSASAGWVGQIHMATSRLLLITRTSFTSSTPPGDDGKRSSKRAGRRCESFGRRGSFRKSSGPRPFDNGDVKICPKARPCRHHLNTPLSALGPSALRFRPGKIATHMTTTQLFTCQAVDEAEKLPMPDPQPDRQNSIWISRSCGCEWWSCASGAAGAGCGLFTPLQPHFYTGICAIWMLRMSARNRRRSYSSKLCLLKLQPNFQGAVQALARDKLHGALF